MNGKVEAPTLKAKMIQSEIYWRNEAQANKMVAVAIIGLCILLMAMWIMNRVGIFGIANDDNLTEGFVLIEIELLIVYAIYKIFKGRRHWIRYMMILMYIIALAYLSSIVSYNAMALMMLPVLLTCRYFSEKFTIGIAIVTAISFGVAAFVCSYFATGVTDLNQVPISHTDLFVDTDLLSSVEAHGFDRESYTYYYMVQGYLPNLLFSILVTMGCYIIVKRGKELTIDTAVKTSKESRVESELSLATQIQANMLPSIFPVYPEHSEFDIYATMNPAKEVGGDFYDIFMTDDKHIAIVIADVSGKGVPAALYMVITKTLIKNHAQLGISPEETLNRVNNILCENNKIGIFVTGWIGIMDIETGLMTYSNAGHNPPLAKLGNSDFDFLEMSPGLVLAGMEDFKFKNAEMNLSPGDKILLYTDGVTEAVNAKNELYGEDRLKEYLDKHSTDTPEGILHGLRADIDNFAGKAEQFDDITMLLFTYKGKGKNKK